MRNGALVLAAFVLVLSSAAAGQEPGPARTRGVVPYQRYCAGCHGLDARGTAVTPGIDLTRLASSWGRPLVGPALLDHLGGRPPLHADWTRNTRVCGEDFLRDLRPGLAAQLLRRGTAMEVLRYLDTIQVEAATETSH